MLKYFEAISSLLMSIILGIILGYSWAYYHNAQYYLNNIKSILP